MRVRMTSQISGTRDGQPWPAPGQEIDLPDSEAQALISGGTAVDSSTESGTVLVPPAGVHTPGRTAIGDESPYVEAPADAVADPEAAKRAAEKAAAGEYDATLPAGTVPQDSSGAALSPEAAEKAADQPTPAVDAKAEKKAAAKPKNT